MYETLMILLLFWVALSPYFFKWAYIHSESYVDTWVFDWNKQKFSIFGHIIMFILAFPIHIIRFIFIGLHQIIKKTMFK